jgi:hypothetical protein
MVDEGQENKSRSSSRGRLRKMISVVRWAWVGVLSVLLPGSILYHTPWRAIGLIAVFLAACTILPRRWRKYFWAAVGLTMLALTIWVFLPDDSAGWRPYVFERETEAFLAKYMVPAQENAASIYESVCRQWEADDPNEPNVPDDWQEETRKGPWRSAEHPEIAAWLDYHKPTVARLMEAAALEKCFFESDVRHRLLFPTSDLPPLSTMRQLAFLLEASANRDWAERGVAAAIEKQLVSLRFGEHLSRQPDELYLLAGQAIESLALQQLNRAIAAEGMDSAYLDVVAASVARMADDWRHTSEGILGSDKLRLKNLLAPGVYQVNEAGRVRWSRDPAAHMRNQMQNALVADQDLDEETRRHFHRALHPGYWQKRVYKADVILNWFLFPFSPARMGKIIDKAYNRYGPMLDSEFDWHSVPPPTLSPMENPDWQYLGRGFTYSMERLAGTSEALYHNLRDSCLRVETARRGTRVTVALRRSKNEHGSWPQDLEAAHAYAKGAPFVDAWGQPFVYQRDGDGFVLYSAGENGRDEKGQHKVEYSDDYRTATTVADDYMIYPDHVPRPGP